MNICCLCSQYLPVGVDYHDHIVHCIESTLSKIGLHAVEMIRFKLDEVEIEYSQTTQTLIEQETRDRKLVVFHPTRSFCYELLKFGAIKGLPFEFDVKYIEQFM